MATVHFLAGLPRSGNTLLSALLNQNPNVYSSPLSPVRQYLDTLDTMESLSSNIRNEENTRRSLNFKSSLFNKFYEDVDNPIIIDREKQWVTQRSLNLITKYITPNPKVIVTVRDVLEILASFIALQPPGFPVEEVCDKFMTDTHSEMPLLLSSLRQAIQPANKGTFLILEYNEIVHNPEITMNKVYSFLEIESFNHDFQNIAKLEVDRDHLVGANPRMHEVSPTLQPSKTDPLRWLPKSVIDKYKNHNSWRNDQTKPFE
jgi:sulfotransferase